MSGLLLRISCRQNSPADKGDRQLDFGGQSLGKGQLRLCTHNHFKSEPYRNCLNEKFGEIPDFLEYWCHYMYNE